MLIARLLLAAFAVGCAPQVQRFDPTIALTGPQVAVLKSQSGWSKPPWDLETINGRRPPAPKPDPEGGEPIDPNLRRDWGHKYIIELPPGPYALGFSYHSDGIASTGGLYVINFTAQAGHTYLVRDNPRDVWPIIRESRE